MQYSKEFNGIRFQTVNRNIGQTSKCELPGFSQTTGASRLRELFQPANPDTGCRLVSEFIVVCNFFAICSHDALLHVSQKPLVIVHHAFNGFCSEGLRGASLLERKSAELGL